MRRFILFSNKQGYGPGLGSDIDGSFETIPEALDRADYLFDYGHLWQQILDTDTGDRPEGAKTWVGPTSYHRWPLTSDDDKWRPDPLT